ncbi:MAG: hypothetical protein NC393_13040 [Clostridium sp.]|nr:hypothetical protein [Clostridium sp.]MCM1173035.1 hypothetical protein [Clostridium sp.]
MNNTVKKIGTTIKNKLRKKHCFPTDLCATKYPLLLVHGVFFRDYRHLNYWGRIPRELVKNGAAVYYGKHQSAASVCDSARELAARIRYIAIKTGAGKVNVIAHSKGGIDVRYAISRYGMDQYVVSLTTINTPHRGCAFADYLINKIPESAQQKIARRYNAVFRRLGDAAPDFLAAVSDLTAAACKERNTYITDSENVYYQSVGSVLNKAWEGSFPASISYGFVKKFDGANDGLVGERSFPWGKRYRLVTTKYNRGVSHFDMTDIARKNIKGFDIRGFYVRLVNWLKRMGF